jgi:hypothetical protein
VIVKKVPTKKNAAPKSRGLHARDLCDYIAGPEAGDVDEKVEHRGAVNLLNLDHESQVQEMADLAETGRRSPQPVQHWILSWRQGEHPTTAQAEEAVRMFLGELGLAEHQCIYAVHRNTDNYHLHLAINRVHPETERVVTVNGGFDIEVAHRAIARIEHAQAWQREAGGRYQVLEQGEVRRAERPRPRLPEPSTRARDFENRTGEKSAQRSAIDEGAEVLRRAKTWGELHVRLAEYGMRFEKKGSGAILWVGEVAVKASVAGRDCSFSALEKRLGTFVPGPDGTKARRRVPEAIEPGVAAWREYAVQRHAHYRGRRQQQELLDKQHRGEREEMLQRHRSERQEIRMGDWKGKGVAVNALRSLLAARQAQEKAAMKERRERQLSGWRERFSRWPSFEEWFRDRGQRNLADEWRFRDRTPAVIVGDADDSPRPRDIRAFSAQVHGWEVRYWRAGVQSAPSFTDRGREIRIHDLSRESVLAALQLSAQKWGTFQVYGSERYKRLCTELAAEHGFKIANPELQAAMLASKEQRIDRSTSPQLPSRTRGRSGPER